MILAKDAKKINDNMSDEQKSRRNELIKKGLIATTPAAGLAYAGYKGAKALARKMKASEDDIINDKKIGKSVILI